jgi:hypothetical protein
MAAALALGKVQRTHIHCYPLSLESSVGYEDQAISGTL